MPVVLNLDGKHPKCRVPNDVWRISIDSEGRETCEGYWDLSYQPGPLDWNQLKRLKNLSDLTYRGPDATVLDFLASRECRVRTFTWSESGRSRFDFSTANAIDNLGIYVQKKSLQLKLPVHGRMDYLRLITPPSGCRVTVVCPKQGEGLRLMIYQGELLSISGLKQLTDLQLFNCRDVDIAAIAKAYPNLKSLDIMGKAVVLSGEAALSKLKSLEELNIHECYNMDVNSFPGPDQLPALQEVNFDGLRREDALLLKEKFQGIKELSIRGKRTAEWIANNLENPFRFWEDYFGATAGKKAMAAWKTASSSIPDSGKKPSKNTARKCLQAFVNVFNQLEQRTGLETDQREEIYDAFFQLVARLPAETVTE
ncbi:MAG: hypothetical protein KDA78_09665, partial [Planctomycetaceae bacterium]|nr:hypothetical protein [Planctomycetaceae bacterium]